MPTNFEKRLLSRIQMFGDTNPATYNFAADIIQLCSDESNLWTNRLDDASRLPDVLFEASEEIRNASSK